MTKHIRRPLRRARLEGMTLIEIMIVVIIMAMIATAVGVMVLPRLEKARIDTARTDSQTIRSAVTMFLAENPGSGCPSIEDLTEGDYLDDSKTTTDPWENEFGIECEGTDVTVISNGPDGDPGTDDDIIS